MSTCVALVMVSSPMNLSSRSKAVFSARPEINLPEIWIQRDDHMFEDYPDFFEDVFIDKQTVGKYCSQPCNIWNQNNCEKSKIKGSCVQALTLTLGFSWFFVKCFQYFAWRTLPRLGVTFLFSKRPVFTNCVSDTKLWVHRHQLHCLHLQILFSITL